MEESLLMCVLLFYAAFIIHSSLSTSAAAAAPINGSFLHLSPGLNLSIPASFNLSSGFPLISSDRMFTVATPTLDGGLFFPILSSPSFNTSSLGFSLGFYLTPLTADPSEFNLFMAVCAGSLGNTSDVYNNLTLNDSVFITFNQTVDGFAAPVWIANVHSPIRDAGQASLMVPDNGLELQLRDGEKVVWSWVLKGANANLLEMQDTGHLNLIDKSTNTSYLLSTVTDSLVKVQSLVVGQELASNDSSYVARLEKRGLVLYMNTTHFNNDPLPTPYWVFPLYSQDAGSYKSLNQLISSAPCSSSPANLTVDDSGHILLYEGSCNSNYSYFFNEYYGNLTVWRLEDDGMLYNYAIIWGNSQTAASVTRSSLLDGIYIVSGLSEFPNDYRLLVLQWEECSVPMACGPLGVCTPGAETLCSCLPETDFEPVNSTNMFQGCKRRIDLPSCTFINGHTSTGSTDFVQLNSTASILLFNEWTFSSTPGEEVNACKQSCSSDCACNGFFYQKTTSSCFFITDGITLLKVVDKIYTSLLHPTGMSTIFAKDYVTFLKVASGNKTTKKSSSKVALMIALSAIIPFLLVCLVLGIVGYLLRAGRKKFVHASMLSREESKELKDILPLLTDRFSYRELFEATEGFSKILGAGGCGSVYAGVLSDGRKVAIKVLQAVPQGPGQSKYFLAEIATIGRTNHNNIVRLVGFCWEVSQRLLVYEFVERGSLDQWIFVRESPVNDQSTSVALQGAPFLDWKTRYNVALGIARGLTYLHEECEQPILHFDIKPQNILLDNDFVAKLADFGMSRLIQRDMSTVVTGMRGTLGYIAPEWSFQGGVSKKCDIYSMGIVLLEIVGGRKSLDFSLLDNSCDPEEREAWHFPSWAARKCEQGLMMELVDRRLHACGFDATQSLRLIYTAFWCIQENPVMRPNAPTVVQWLDGSSTVEQPPFSMAANAGKHSNKLVPISSSMSTSAHLT